MATIARPIAMYTDTIRGLDIGPVGEDAPKKPVRRLLRLFNGVGEPRLETQLVYPLGEILLTAFLATLCGARTWVDIANYGRQNEKWLRRFMPLVSGTPSHDTFRRTFGLIDPEELQRATVAFLTDNIRLMRRAFKIEGPLLYNVDGKEERGTGRLHGTPRETKNLQTLHVYDASDGVCLVSVAIGEKTNEIPTAQDALRKLQLKGVIVSFDAMHTQRETVAVIAGRGGGYVGALKRNQQGFVDDVASYFTADRLRKLAEKRLGDFPAGKATFLERKEKARNRIETRRYYLTRNTDWFYDKGGWAKLASFVCVVTTTESLATGKKTEDTLYYISSLTDIELAADAIRGHWSVENQLHWQLDVNFDEDKNMTADRNAALCHNLMNKLCLTLTKMLAPIYKVSVRSARYMIGWDMDGAARLLCGLDERILAAAMLKVNVKK